MGGGHKVLSGFKAAGKRGFWFTQRGAGVGEISTPWLGSHSPMTPDEAGVGGYVKGKVGCERMRKRKERM